MLTFFFSGYNPSSHLQIPFLSFLCKKKTTLLLHFKINQENLKSHPAIIIRTQNQLLLHCQLKEFVFVRHDGLISQLWNNRKISIRGAGSISLIPVCIYYMGSILKLVSRMELNVSRYRTGEKQSRPVFNLLPIRARDFWGPPEVTRAGLWHQAGTAGTPRQLSS